MNFVCDNQDLDFWLHQGTKTAQVPESPVVEKKQLPTDNLSTWLSTRYAANLTKKSSETAPAPNLDMWLAEKRRKLSCENDCDQEISKWLLPGAVAEDQEGKRKRTCVVEDMATMTLEQETTNARLCPALSNWQAQADMPLDEWLHNNSATNANGPSMQDTSDDCWLRGPVAEVRSEFVFPDLPVQSWLAPPPPTPLDEAVERLALVDQTVGSWLDESEEFGGKDDIAQWLLVEGHQEDDDQDSLIDDGSSIVVLDSSRLIEDDDDSKSVASSWKFW